MNYNPSAIGLDNGKIFGLPFNFNDAKIIILPVPWELTTSFGKGTSNGPSKILEASRQLDLFHLEYPEAWKKGIYMLAISNEILKLNNKLKTKATEIILLQEKGKTQESLKNEIAEINAACVEMNDWVLEQTKKLLQNDKKVILLGGDHSTPLGYLRALAQQYNSFGILQIDAHADLRNSYEGFTYSHASIMYNALNSTQINNLTAVGIRDICEEEVEFSNSDARINLVYDQHIQQNKFNGVFWKQQVEEIVNQLPKNVYISFDIDGLNPIYCPNTGTPVPGGLEYQEAIEIIRAVKKSGRHIIGADLNEVGNADWDANVGARILYELCVHTI